MNTQNLINLSATELVADLKSGDVSLEVVLERLAKHRAEVEPEINAFDSVVTMPQPARPGALCGLPISVKDQLAVAGHPRNFGLDKASGKAVSATASVVERFVESGATIIGKTSMPPYALDLQTFNERAGRTNNPWDVALTPGGSSGGSAAAVASGMSYLDIGADLSGSLRLPAAYCGVCSLLPTEGAIENDGLLLDAARLAHFARPGPIARTVEDLALAWSVMSETRRPGGEASQIRLAILDGDMMGLPVTADLQTVFQSMEGSLTAEDIVMSSLTLQSLFRPEVYSAFGRIMGFETGALLPWLIRWLSVLLGKEQAKRSPNFLAHVHKGYTRDRSDYARALQERDTLKDEFDEEIEAFDAVLLPVCGVQPFAHRLPHSERGGVRDYTAPFEIDGSQFSYLDTLTAFTVPVSLMGNPVVTLPIGMDASGLPVGAQLVGKRGGEWELLRIAAKLATILQIPACPVLRKAINAI